MEEGETVMVLTKARALLMILLATCEQTLIALEAAANILDVELTEDLRRMIARSWDEVSIIDEKLAALRG